MKKAILTAGFIPILLTACETGPYAQGPGFYETRIEQNRYRIAYRSPRGMPRDQVEDLTLLRAADMTLSEGYDWFRVLARQGVVDRPNGPVISLGGGNTSFGRNSAVSLGLGASFNLSGPPAQTLIMEIQMGRGGRPDDSAAYDAADVERTIRSRL